MRVHAISKRILILGLFLVWGGIAAAQEPGGRDFTEEERREEMDRTADYSQSFWFDYGGWIRIEYFNFEDPPTEPTREMEIYDLRLWASANIGNAHRFYIRTLTQYSQFHEGDAFIEKTYDLRGMNLDQGYYELNLRPLFEGESYKKAGTWETKARLGRQFYRMGRGLVYNQVHEGLAIDAECPDWTTKVIAAKTVESQNDFDTTRPTVEESRRRFYGAELAYRGLAKHRFYGYILVQRDHNRESPEQVGQDFDYNSEYWGLGASGQILPWWRYFAEGVYETGRSTASGSTGQEAIDAWGADLGMEAFPAAWSTPRFSVEYMFGSGDNDSGNVLGTIGGNAAGTTDTTFRNFGFTQTGYSFYPQLSNIHVLRLGGAFHPFEGVSPWVEGLELGANVYWYWKENADGAISDYRADKDSRRLGHEIDVYARWRILSDLSLSMNYGYFEPGAAYSQPDDRSYFSTAVTYSF